MPSRIEIESKYFCKDIKMLYKIIENEKMKETANINEVDEYFTDVNSEYIKNRVCLRIRRTDGKDMELTFKGKSNVLSSSYAKKESNFKLNITDYEEFVSFLSSLGFYSYVEVNKKRKVFSRTEDDLIYNIMIDYINDIGEFVEFEILSEDDNKLIDLLEIKLEQFIYKFREVNMDVAKSPYRDFVAISNYNNITFNKKKEALLLDLDGTLINSEHEFFCCFKNVIYSKFGYEISLDEYVDNELNKNNNLINYLKEKLIIKKDIIEEDIMKLVYDLYEKRFINILENEDTAVNIELL